MRELCLPVGLEPDAVRQLDQIISSRTRVRKRESLYRPGDLFRAVYAIRLGTFKTTLLAEDGREQITGYHMAGEVVGLDGISNDRPCLSGGRAGRQRSVRSSLQSARRVDSRKYRCYGAISIASSPRMSVATRT
jgi:CRP-like cAMP-binding protein